MPSGEELRSKGLAGFYLQVTNIMQSDEWKNYGRDLAARKSICGCFRCLNLG